MARLGEIPDLNQCLRNLIAQVPPGRVTTYGRLAEALGSRMAARWVGGADGERNMAAAKIMGEDIAVWLAAVVSSEAAMPAMPKATACCGEHWG